ncbi:MAG: GNAT family N-acetyltransferase [Promethearchaeota archaeon]|nr:MAG: GNAT family N-acetyltransferase [Candidatus Lokiarchaeota archaeon]
MSDDIIKEEDIIIRNYRTSDYQATLKILLELQSKFNIGFVESKWRETSGLRQFKPNLKRITLIAELKSTGQVVSLGMLEGVKNNLGQYLGYLNNWATKKEFIGKGVGQILADRATQILKSWGCEAVRINMAYGGDKKLQKLIDVFGKVGFKPIITVLEKKFETD